jgi:hypothetical protein
MSSHYTLLFALALVGCGDPGNIPCISDDNCPTGWYCDTLATCRRMGTKASPPDVVFDGVASSRSGPFGSSIDFDPTTKGGFFISLTNHGSDQGEPVVTLSGADCLGLTSPGNAIGVLDGGQSTVQSIDALPTKSCQSPLTVMVDVVVPYHGADGSEQRRQRKGSFMVRLSGGAAVANGGVCARAADCASGFCVDGVCCQSACSGQCETCAQTGQLGTCVAVSGTPAEGRSPCTGSGTTCGGRCDGNNRATCSYPTSSCGVSACDCTGSGPTFRCAETVPTCSAGSCVAMQTSCGYFVCETSLHQCKTTCSSDIDCVASTPAGCVGSPPHC